MKKLISLILSITLLFLICGCNKASMTNGATEESASEYLTSFFSSYSKMNSYLKNRDIAISAFALDGQGLSSILKAVYQAQGVTYAFHKPVKIADNTFVAVVTVVAPDIEPLYEMYAIDRILAEDEVEDSFVAQSFYDNIRQGTTQNVTTNVNITLRYNSITNSWSVDPSNDLAFAIFPNIDKAG